ncbi:MAG TPA: hypothetical protein VFO73_07770 [Candidatus Limnocylindrales bacterium]|nr:hypothetical protein [Candidatus Limnocylindrales bacterium]
MQPDPVRTEIPATVLSAVDTALDALEALAELGEEIDDEWQYVQDLRAAWRDRLEVTAAARGGDPIQPAVGTAIARLADEAALIRDPHRAIDWLSTLPQVALVALGERP